VKQLTAVRVKPLPKAQAGEIKKGARINLAPKVSV
jgi:hypothetical protein